MTQGQMPSTAEEAVRQINEAFRPEYELHFHYDERIEGWGTISIDRSRGRGDNPVDIVIGINSPDSINFDVIRAIVDGYDFQSTNPKYTADTPLTFRYESGFARITASCPTSRPGEETRSQYSLKKR